MGFPIISYDNMENKTATIMKAITFYTTITAIMLTLCMTSLEDIVAFLLLDILLLICCRKCLTYKDVKRISGYNVWMKMIGESSE
jgi:hypothetical protein